MTDSGKEQSLQDHFSEDLAEKDETENNHVIQDL